jgi:Ca-activated chloride channel family protein
MFTSKKNLRLIDYQDSYYFRQQRKKRRNKWLKLSLLLVLIFLFTLVFVPYAKSTENNLDKITKNKNAYIHGPQLIFEHPNPSQRATLPVDIVANIQINGLVAYAEIKQTFINPHAVALEGTYQFPLPENSAVKQLRIKVGDIEIVGEIMEKTAAKAVYKKAKKQGKKASLLVQKRPNLFINKIANIPAQSSVTVTLTFIMPVSFSEGKFNLRLPLAMTDKYQPKSNSHLSNEYSKRPKPLVRLTEIAEGLHTKSADSDELSAEKYTFEQSRSVAPSQSTINIELNSGIPITAIYSDSHKIEMRPLSNNQNAYDITLNKNHVISNKTFDLNWQLLASSQPQVSSFTQEISDEYYTLLTFFPPKLEVAKVIARDIIFIIDTSGSMQGQSMEQAKASLQLAILQLNDKDSFNIIAFDDATELLFANTKMASGYNIQKAQDFIDDLSADGGTEMYRPFSNALIMKKNENQSTKAIRQIVFITDGAVTNELELMQLLSSANGDFRLYTVGIGAASNGYFMKKAAQFGRGSYVFIQNQSEVKQKMTDFMTKISQPAISNVELILDNQVHQHVEVYPKKIPDLYFAEPLQITLKSQFPITSAQLTGQTASTSWYQQLIIDDTTSSKGISSLWARKKIGDLLDSLVIGGNKEDVKMQVIDTSLNHQIISPYTSFVAVEKQANKSSMLAKNNLSLANKAKNRIFQAHESLMVAMPKTSIGWKLQFLFGLSLLILVRISDFTWLINMSFKKVNKSEKTH